MPSPASRGESMTPFDRPTTSPERTEEGTDKPFDYSSRLGWDVFYENGIKKRQEEDGPIEVGVVVESSPTEYEYEWHSHIPHSAIAEAIRPAISAASSRYRPRSSRQSGRAPSILLVGCGNSGLPRALHDAFDADVRVTCLDYSPACIDAMRSLYGNAYPNVDFVVGDATDLGGVVWNEVDGAGDLSGGDTRWFDVVVDKGLLDALMCGEGFDVERLMGGINDVLVPHSWGMHVLICFPLSTASKRILEEFPGLEWDFDIPVEGSENGRASFNLARRCRRQGADVML
ncbi:hypothetical protein ACHAW5_010400 [Stephanodiscus triporus]|uniref:Methyltransferase domain-containing protein n=1 Tax=Stephanodiscus triporus TaxID=2934178 RepID=A0ABD3Q3P7_9STRA